MGLARGIRAGMTEIVGDVDCLQQVILTQVKSYRSRFPRGATLDSVHFF